MLIRAPLSQDVPATASYRLFKQREIAADIKEAVCRVGENAFRDSDHANTPTTPYELPDGNTLEATSPQKSFTNLSTLSKITEHLRNITDKSRALLFNMC